MSEFFTTYAKEVVNGDYVIAKMVTGETVMGILDKEAGVIDDVALIIPHKPEDGSENQQMAFYTIPYGLPLIRDIKGEPISLRFIIKCFAIPENMKDLVEHYEKIKSGDFENE